MMSQSVTGEHPTLYASTLRMLAESWIRQAHNKRDSEIDTDRASAYAMEYCASQILEFVALAESREGE